MNVRGSLSPTEIETMLTETTIPIRLGCQTPGGLPWMVSLWYRYRADDDRWTLECATNQDAKITSYLTETPDVSFEVSTNQPPYKGVRGRGTATIEPDPTKETLRTLLERYLGGTDSDLAGTLLSEDREEVTITIEPVVVYGWDFSDRMSELDEREGSQNE